MNSNSTHQTDLKKISTYLITGFLGSGKTSTLSHLLANKPAGEHWAVMINEFGEARIDAGQFDNDQQNAGKITLKEVPSGCLCCASGLPMQTALNSIITQTKPDRLFIEAPSQLNPVKLLEELNGERYNSSVTVEQVITLLDARNLAHRRYTSHAVFNQQLKSADLIVANKADQYQTSDKDRLNSYLKEIESHAQVIIAEQGAINMEALQE